MKNSVQKFLFQCLIYKYDLEDTEGTKYAVVQEGGKYVMKYMGHLNEETEDIKAKNLKIKDAIKMRDEHNAKLAGREAGREESFRDKHSIERTVGDSDIREGVTDHHGREVQ